MLTGRMKAPRWSCRCLGHAAPMLLDQSLPTRTDAPFRRSALCPPRPAGDQPDRRSRPRQSGERRKAGEAPVPLSLRRSERRGNPHPGAHLAGGLLAMTAEKASPMPVQPDCPACRPDIGSPRQRPFVQRPLAPANAPCPLSIAPLTSMDRNRCAVKLREKCSTRIPAFTFNVPRNCRLSRISCHTDRQIQRASPRILDDQPVDPRAKLRQQVGLVVEPHRLRRRQHRHRQLQPDQLQQRAASGNADRGTPR